MTRETITIEPCTDSLRGQYWSATFESYDGPESPIGFGLTPVEACEMLMEAINWEMPA